MPARGVERFGGVRKLNIVAFIKVAVAEEFERRTAELVHAGLGEDCDDRAGRGGVIGGVIARPHS